MGKGDTRSEVAQLYKSLASSTLEPNKRAVPKVLRTVNDRIGDSRREQRKRDSALRPKASTNALVFPPPPDSIDVVDGVVPRPASAYNPPSSSSRSAPSTTPATPARRAPSGPPPPRSWVAPSTADPRRANGRSTTSSSSIAHPLHLLPHTLLPVFAPSYLETPPLGPPRLLILCLQALLPLLATHDLSSLPRHLREGLVSLAGRTRGGLTDDAARDLLWDLRDWNPPTRPPDTGSDDDDWEDEKEEDVPAPWTTLDLTSTGLLHSTIKQLLLPISTTPPTTTPVISLSMAFAAAHLNLSTVLAILPTHLRVLSVAGMRLSPPGTSVASHPTTSILVRLALATPMLHHLDLSYTSPPIHATDVARLPWTGVKECWTSLKVLGLRGLARDGPEDGADGLDSAERDAESLRVVRGAMRGRRAGWVEVIVS